VQISSVDIMRGKEGAKKEENGDRRSLLSKAG
jgi:hypothetical protein